ncbi:MAG: hypothetical protein MJZ20_05115 [Bacteroidaceae bacterium]|nr:hypothetical protein [Bacteroidaceae bacterium]
MTYEEFKKSLEEPPVVDLKLTNGEKFRKVKYLGIPYTEKSRDGDRWYKFELQSGMTLYVPSSRIACFY